MILFLASLVILRSAAAADVGYFWHVSDFHLDPRYGSNVTRAGARDIFLGDYDEVSMSCTVELKESGFFLIFIVLQALINAPMHVDSENL